MNYNLSYQTFFFKTLNQRNQRRTHSHSSSGAPIRRFVGWGTAAPFSQEHFVHPAQKRAALI